MDAEKEYWKNATEVELISFMKSGERGAFVEIYDRTWKMMYNMVYNKVKTVEATEEVMIEVLSSFWTNREKHKHPTMFPNLMIELSTYLTQYFEKEGNHPDSPDPLKMLALKMLSPEQIKANQQLSECIDVWLYTVPDIRFDIYHLKCVDGLNNGQIAAKLKMKTDEVTLEVRNILEQFEAFLGNSKK